MAKRVKPAESLSVRCGSSDLIRQLVPDPITGFAKRIYAYSALEFEWAAPQHHKTVCGKCGTPSTGTIAHWGELISMLPHGNLRCRKPAKFALIWLSRRQGVHNPQHYLNSVLFVLRKELAGIADNSGLRRNYPGARTILAPIQ